MTVRPTIENFAPKVIPNVDIDAIIPRFSENIMLLIFDKNSVKFLSEDNIDVLTFKYDLKSGSLLSNIFTKLTSLKLIDENFNKNSLYPLATKELDANLYHVYLLDSSVLINNPKLKWITIDKLTNVTNKYHKIYLDLFLKIFSDVNLTSLFKY